MSTGLIGTLNQIDQFEKVVPILLVIWPSRSLSLAVDGPLNECALHNLRPITTHIL